jgi:hypothetical protein
MKEQIFEFIKIKTPNLLGVLEVKLKDTDDEYGIINEHYIVRCLLQAPDTSIPVYNMLGERERVCLVSVSEFNSWLKNENSIKWI